MNTPLYNSVKEDLKYDPESAKDLPQQHEDFLFLNDFYSWRDSTLGKFDARSGKFAPQAKIPRQRKPRS